MSYATALEALHNVLRNSNKAPGLLAVVIGEPASIQTLPMLYSELVDFSSESQESVKQITYRSRHTLVIGWQDRPAAEQQLAVFVNSIPAAVDADSTLGGKARNAEIVSGDADWQTWGDNEFRTLVFQSEITEIVRYGA